MSRLFDDEVYVELSETEMDANDEYFQDTVDREVDAYDRCAECGYPIDCDDYTSYAEVHEELAYNNTENIVDGYRCSNCGHEEKF